MMNDEKKVERYLEMELSVERIQRRGLKLELADMVSQKVPDFEERMNYQPLMDLSSAKVDASWDTNLNCLMHQKLGL
jgi:hypothetical protein